MLSDLKKLSRQSVVYGASAAAGRMLTLITAPILTRIFEPADYGMIALVQLAVSLAIIFAGMNLGSGLTYYYFHYEDDTTRRRVISTGFSIIVLAAMAISLLLYIFAPQISALFNIRQSSDIQSNIAPYLQIASLSLFFGLVMTASQSILRILQKPHRYLAVELVALLGNFFFILVFVVWLRLGVIGVFWSGVAGSCAGMLLGLFFVKEKFGAKISMALLTPMLLYAMPQLPGVIVNWTQSQVGRIFINYYTTLEQQGLYSIAFTLGSVLLIFTTAFRLAYDPYSLSIMKRPDARQTYATFYAIYAFLFCVLLGGAVGFAKPALMILTPVEYHSAHATVFWIAGATFLMGANNIMGTGIWITRRTAFTSYAQIVTFMTVIPASYILVPQYQAIGAAMAYFMGTLAQSLAYYFFAQRLYSIPYRYWRVHIMLLISLTAAAAHSQVVDDKNLWASTGYGFVTWLTISLAAFFFAFEPGMRRNIISFIRDKYRWIKHPE